MKSLYYTGLVGLLLFEVANVYFIMPMPGSQQYNSIDVAYFLYSYRWVFRIAFALMIVAGASSAFRTRWRWLPLVAAVPPIVVAYFFNFRMTADHMFLQPGKVTFAAAGEHQLNDSSIVVAVNVNDDARAYPIRYIQYHHQVRDTVGGQPIMVTYCNVCRTGRVFEPVVDGKPEMFRLVGMDHYNAMFEDQTTGSWWRQANGEAITGSLKGTHLPEVASNQFSLKSFFKLYPQGKVMLGDTDFKTSYDTLGRFEKGKSKGRLTRTDSLSWKDKSWVIGLEVGGKSKAYDWLEVSRDTIVHDVIGVTPVLIVIASDRQSFVALQRNSSEEFFAVRNDSIVGEDARYDLSGRAMDGRKLKPVKAYQEFWHSWRQFHPDTEQYHP